MTAIWDYPTGDCLRHDLPFDFPIELESDEAAETYNTYEPTAISDFARNVSRSGFFRAKM